MSSKKPRSKAGALDNEINYLAKILFGVMLLLSFLIIVMDGLLGSWYFKYFRCVLLLCSIIPISMRLNLDFAKLYYSYKINNDEAIPGTVARTTTIPEELGRIQFLLSDKTGTLTKNDMIFKKLNLEFYSFSEENLDDIMSLLKKGLKKTKDKYRSIVGYKMSSDVTSDEASVLNPSGF
jgi:phospholipid-translocating ATPase